MLRNRPAAFLCLVFSAGIAAGLFFANSALTVVATIGIIILGSLVFKPQSPKIIKAVVLTLAALFAGVFYAKLFTFVNEPIIPEDRAQYTFTAAIRKATPRDDYTYIEAEVQDSHSCFNGERFCMYLSPSEHPDEGVVISFTGKLALGNYSNKSNGVTYVAIGGYTERYDLSPKGFYFKALNVRQKVGAFIDRAYNGETASFYKALLIGDRSGLNSEFNADFSRSGLSHVMAISGQHFSLIIFNAYFLLITIIRRKRICCVLSIILAIAYTVLAGASPSIIRSAFMCCLVFATNYFNEEGDPLINLSFALVILLCFNPYAIVNTSLQLSFLATMGIIFTVYHLERFYTDHGSSKWLQLIVTPAAMSVAASLFCAPVFLSRFDYISLVSPITNIFVNWLISIAMVSGIVVLIPAIMIPKLSVIPSLPYEAIRAIAKWSADLRYACVSVNMPYVNLLAFPSLFTVFAFAFYRPKKGVKVLFGALITTLIIVTGCFFIQHQSRKNNALFYDRGTEFNSYSFYADENLSILIDGKGKSAAHDVVLKNGYTYVDCYVITACNDDSLARLKMTMPYTPIETVFIPHAENEHVEKIKAFALKNGCNVVLFDDGILKISSLTVHTPCDENDDGGYVITAEKNGSAVYIIGPSSNRIGQVEDKKYDLLAITRAGAYDEFNFDTFDVDCDKIIVCKNDIIYNYLMMRDSSNSFEQYTGELLLKFGECGVVKE